jgi:threonine/homoserine/homoserine lactone efflux protein
LIRDSEKIKTRAMIPFHEMLLFALAALVLVITPGPNMIYLISRSITQGKKAGVISLAGVITGFIFHIVMASAGLTAILFAVPLAYTILKIIGVSYLLYLACQSIGPNSRNVFEIKNNLQADKPGKLFSIGFLTNVLNPKVAIFYVSFFPQFIKPAYGSIMTQSLQLGATHIILCFCVHFIIVMTASKAARFFASKPSWIKLQKWFMASVLAGLAIKIAFTKAK